MSDKTEDLSDFEQRVVTAGHTLKRDKDGRVDSWVMSYDIHNGPGCTVCGDSWCEHCPGRIEPCDGGKAQREGEAAARVALTAPDGLALAKALVARADNVGGECRLWREVDMARAIIAKAEG